MTLGSLFVVGVLHWGIFLQFGDIPFTGLDWPQEKYHYGVLRESIREGAIPYFVSPEPPFVGNSYFLGIPQTVLSPQIFLLPLMSLGQFIFLNTVIFYSLGFWGCLLIRKRYHLSLLPFTVLFLLFNFNGHITAHISVGHTMWNGYFLLPFFFLLVFDLGNSARTSAIRTSIPLSFVLFGMVLQGSLHVYIWCLMFLVLVALFNRPHVMVIGLTVIFSLCLSLFRLLPVGFNFEDYERASAYGFPTLNVFIDALTSVRAFTFEHVWGNAYGWGWWEHDSFIGIIGVLVIAYFGIYHRFSSNPSVEGHRFQTFDLPILVFILFSFGVVFNLVADLKIPIVSWTERVPSRFFIIPLVALIIIATIRMQALLPSINRNTTFKVLAVAGIVELTHSLANHSWFWRIRGPGTVESVADFVFNQPSQSDAFYITTVNISAALSFVSIVLLLGYWLWDYFKYRG